LKKPKGTTFVSGHAKAKLCYRSAAIAHLLQTSVDWNTDVMWYCFHPWEGSIPHNFELSHIHDDRNFIVRMLFYPYHNA